MKHFSKADGLPGHLARRRASRFCPAMTNGDGLDTVDQLCENLLHLLIGVDAPQPLLLDPAVETVAGDAAPAGGATLDLGDDARLQAGCDRTGLIGANSSLVFMVMTAVRRPDSSE